MHWEWQSGQPKLREIHPADPDITLHQGINEENNKTYIIGQIVPYVGCVSESDGRIWISLEGVKEKG